MSIGERLRQYGLSNFKTLKSFAEYLGMKPASLQTYLRNESLPGAIILTKLAQSGCDINWLLTGEYCNNSSAQKELLEKISKENERLRTELKTLSETISGKIEDILRPINYIEK
jgi:transcriptional regulator with XRE-family HTH domain